jgi:hypothetical protein
MDDVHGWDETVVNPDHLPVHINGDYLLIEHTMHARSVYRRASDDRALHPHVSCVVYDGATYALAWIEEEG